MPKKRTYEVLALGSKCLVVEATSKREALQKANFGSASLRGFEADEYHINDELKTPEDIASAIRHGAEDLR